MRRFFRSYVAAIALAALAALVVRAWIVEAYRIPTDFMAPTLLAGDHIFVDKTAYRRWGLFGRRVAPARGDVVVFSFPSQPRKDFIKRVIAMEGDEVSLEDALVRLNGKVITRGDGEELDGRSYGVRWEADSPQPRRMTQLKVPPGQVFVLGDNRSRGQDSRNWGFVSAKFIKGKATRIWFSSARTALGLKIRWQRFFKRVD